MGHWVSCSACAGTGRAAAQAGQAGEPLCPVCHGLGSIYTIDQALVDEYEFVYDED